MFTPFVDLHTHTQRSDGRLAPEELIAKAYEVGIRVMAITDHNYTEDLTELREFAASQFEEEMTLIQGAEISALYKDGIELHIVALGFDPEEPNMKSMLERHRPDRRPYIDQILAKLREHQIDLGSYDDIVKRFPDTKYIGRMALARCLFEDGYTSSVDQSFDLYLGAHGERRAYVKNPLKYSSLEEVVRTIIQAAAFRSWPIFCTTISMMEIALVASRRKNWYEPSRNWWMLIMESVVFYIRKLLVLNY